MGLIWSTNPRIEPDMNFLFEIVFQAIFEAGSYLAHRRFGLLGCGVSILLLAAIATLLWSMAI